MDYTEIIELIVKTLALIVGILIILLYPKFTAWLKTKVTEKQFEQIMQYIKIFVSAAEQTLKIDDPTGEKRKAYVVSELTKLGIEVNEQVDAIIEAQVLELKK